MISRHLRMVASVITFTFVVTSLNPVSFANAQELPVSPFKTLEIPAELGQVTDSIVNDSSAPAFIHIQSAHGNYAAEKNIEKLLGYIEQNSKIRLMLLEGAANKLQPGLFRMFPGNPDFNRKATDKLMQEGYLTGPETFLVESQKRSEGWGVEDLEAYKKDRDAFIAVAKAEKAVQPSFREFRSALERRFTSKLSKDLLALARQEAALDAGMLSYDGWLKLLGEASKKYLKLDLADAFYQNEYPFLVRYDRLQVIGSKIDREKAHQEAEAFLKDLGARKISPDILSNFQTLLRTPEAELLKKDSGAQSYSSMRRAFDLAYEKLPQDFSMSVWPQWTLYAQYIILMQELEGKGLHEETLQLKERIQDALAKSADEKEYLRLSRDLRLLKRLFELELTRSEFETVQSRDISVQGFLEAVRGARGSVKVSPSLQAVFVSAIHFYKIAVLRENLMFQNALKKMSELKENRAVIVTGGFHAEGLKKLAAAKGCSYLQITPRIAEVTKHDHAVYLRSILGAREFEASQMSAVLATDPAAMQAVLRSEIRGWIISVRSVINGLISTEPATVRAELSAAFSGSLLNRLPGMTPPTSTIGSIDRGETSQQQRKLVRANALKAVGQKLNLPQGFHGDRGQTRTLSPAENRAMSKAKSRRSEMRSNLAQVTVENKQSRVLQGNEARELIREFLSGGHTRIVAPGSMSELMEESSRFETDLTSGSKVFSDDDYLYVPRYFSTVSWVKAGTELHREISALIDQGDVVNVRFKDVAISARSEVRDLNSLASLIETHEIPKEHYQGEWYQIAYETAGSRRHIDANILARHQIGFSEMVKNDDKSKYKLKERFEKGWELVFSFDNRPGEAEAARFMASIAVAQGFKVRLVNRAMPSPVAAEMSRKGKPVIATIALTASHVALKRNKKDAFGKKLPEEEYVIGLKFFVDNAPQPDELGKEIEKAANNPSLNQYPMIPLEKLGDVPADRLTIVNDVSEIYRESRERMWKAFGGEAFKAKVAAYLQKHPNFVLHYSSIHGAMGDYAPGVFEMFGIPYKHYDKQPMDEVTQDEALRRSLEGKRRNAKGDEEYWKPDPTQAQNWSEEWKAAVDHAGTDDFFAMNDGDGDRLVAMLLGMDMDALNPNRVGLIALDHLSRRLGQDGGVLRTVPTSRGLDAHRRAMGKSSPVVVPVGSRQFDPYLDGMLLAVEESGHQFFTLNGESFIDNGVANLLLLLDAMFTTDKRPQELLAEAWSFIEKETGVKELFQKRLSIAQNEVTPPFQDFVVWLRTEGAEQKAVREAIVGEIAKGLGKTLHAESPLSTVDILGLGFAFSDETGGTLRNSGTELLTRNYVEYAKGENPEQQAALAEKTLLKYYREKWLNPLTEQVLKTVGTVLAQTGVRAETAIPSSERSRMARAVEAEYGIGNVPEFESNRWQTPSDIIPYVSRQIRLQASARSETREIPDLREELMRQTEPVVVSQIASMQGRDLAKGVTIQVAEGGATYRLQSYGQTGYERLAVYDVNTGAIILRSVYLPLQHGKVRVVGSALHIWDGYQYAHYDLEYAQQRAGAALDIVGLQQVLTRPYATGTPSGTITRRGGFWGAYPDAGISQGAGWIRIRYSGFANYIAPDAEMVRQIMGVHFPAYEVEDYRPSDSSADPSFQNWDRVITLSLSRRSEVRDLSSIASLIETREIPKEHYQGEWYQIAYETAGSRRHMDANIIARHMIGFLEMVKNDDKSRYNLKKRWEEDQELIISYDSRPGQAEYARQMAAIAVAQGFKVRLIDKSMPSPVAAEMSRKGKPVIATIALTASHVALRRNKKDAFGKKLSEEEYVTGLKFFVDNAPQPDELGKAIEGPSNDPALNHYPMIPLEKLGAVPADRLTIVKDTSEIYRESRERLWKAFGGEVFKAKVAAYLQKHPNFVLHYSSIHGAMGDYAPGVFEMFGIPYKHYDKQPMDEVSGDEALRQSLEGKRQNLKGDLEYWKPDPTQAQNWSKEWKEAVDHAGADDFFGMNDGDGDRLVAMLLGMDMDALNPNRIGLIALDHLSRRLGQDGGVLRTVPTSRGLDAHRRAMGKSSPVVVPVGSRQFDPYLDGMLLAVEESGHQFFTLNGESFIDNGVANLLLLLDAMFTTDKKPQELLAEAWSFIEKETGVKELFQKRLSIAQNEVTPPFQDFVVWLRTEGAEQKAVREAIVGEIAKGLGKTLHAESPLSTVDILGLGFAFSDETGGTLRNSGTELLTRNYVEYAKGENPEQQAALAEKTLLKYYREKWLNPLTEQVLRTVGTTLAQTGVSAETAIPSSERSRMARAVEAEYRTGNIPEFESNRWQTPSDIIPYVSRQIRLQASARSEVRWDVDTVKTLPSVQALMQQLTQDGFEPQIHSVTKTTLTITTGPGPEQLLPDMADPASVWLVPSHVAVMQETGLGLQIVSRSEVREGLHFGITPEFLAANKSKMVPIFISGGEGPGVNDFFAYAARSIRQKGLIPVAMKNGIKAFVGDNLHERIAVIDPQAENYMIGQGGAEAGTSRIKLTNESEKDIRSALQNMKGFNSYIAIGGGDHAVFWTTFAAGLESRAQKGELSAEAFGEFKGLLDGIVNRMIVVYKTVDGDVFGQPLGFETAVESAQRKIYAAAASGAAMNKITVVRVMGADVGRLSVRAGSKTPQNLGALNFPGVRAGESALGKQVAKYRDSVIILIPEVPVSIGELLARVRDIKKMYGSVTVVVSEGFVFRGVEQTMEAGRRVVKVTDPMLSELLANDEEAYHAWSKFLKTPSDPHGNIKWNGTDQDLLVAAAIRYFGAQERFGKIVKKSDDVRAGDKVSYGDVRGINSGYGYFDRWYAQLLGLKVADLIAKNQFGVVVSLPPDHTALHEFFLETVRARNERTPAGSLNPILDSVRVESFAAVKGFKDRYGLYDSLLAWSPEELEAQGVLVPKGFRDAKAAQRDLLRSEALVPGLGGTPLLEEALRREEVEIAARSEVREGVLPRVNPTKLLEWKMLRVLAPFVKRMNIAKAFKNDPTRREWLSVDVGDIYFDGSKNLISKWVLNLLIKLAEKTKLRTSIELMFAGAKINETENRAVLHTALRNIRKDEGTGEWVSAGPVIVDGKDVMPEVLKTLSKMAGFVQEIYAGELGGRTGYTGKRFKNVVSIGIGGSYLGPEMAAMTLAVSKATGMNFYFVANVDGADAASKVTGQMPGMLEGLDPEETLVIVESKTFTTRETIMNAETVRDWLLKHYGGDRNAIASHFVAVSTAEKLVKEFGIDTKNMFEFWDWVGGRYSMWSAIGLPIMLAIGPENFYQMLAGAHAMDVHYRTAPFSKNIPVLKALLNIWNRIFLGMASFIVAPYSQLSSRLGAYLQQLFMESLGKSIDRNGERVTYNTSSEIYGEPMTNGQHAYQQQPHQGYKPIPEDFIGFIRPSHTVPGHHAELLANFFGQTEALAVGKSTAEVLREIKEDQAKNPKKYEGWTEEDFLWFSSHKTFEGSKPTNLILIDELTPFALGELIAMYEHQVATEGFILNIFSYDQWGVELGKVLAKKVGPLLQGTKEIATAGLTASTAFAIQRVLERQTPEVSSAAPAVKPGVSPARGPSAPVRQEDRGEKARSEVRETAQPAQAASFGAVMRTVEQVTARILPLTVAAKAFASGIARQLFPWHFNATPAIPAAFKAWREFRAIMAHSATASKGRVLVDLRQGIPDAASVLPLADFARYNPKAEVVIALISEDAAAVKLFERELTTAGASDVLGKNLKVERFSSDAEFGAQFNARFYNVAVPSGKALALVLDRENAVVMSKVGKQKNLLSVIGNASPLKQTASTLLVADKLLGSLEGINPFISIIALDREGRLGALVAELTSYLAAQVAMGASA